MGSDREPHTLLGGLRRLSLPLVPTPRVLGNAAGFWQIDSLHGVSPAVAAALSRIPRWTRTDRAQLKVRRLIQAEQCLWNLGEDFQKRTAWAVLCHPSPNERLRPAPCLCRALLPPIQSGQEERGQTDKATERVTRSLSFVTCIWPTYPCRTVSRTHWLPPWRFWLAVHAWVESRHGIHRASPWAASVGVGLKAAAPCGCQGHLNSRRQDAILPGAFSLKVYGPRY